MEEIDYKRIENLKEFSIQNRIKEIQIKIENKICSSLPNAFWNRKKHVVNLLYSREFNALNIPTKAKPIQANSDLLTHSNLIRPSKSRGS